MQMCPHPASAIRVHRRTIDMIRALEPTVPLSIRGVDTLYFMIYCAGSDHEETEIITSEVYDRTYEAMPDHVHAMNVRTID